jgi:hypothetical protein
MRKLWLEQLEIVLIHHASWVIIGTIPSWQLCEQFYKELFCYTCSLITGETEEANQEEKEKKMRKRVKGNKS